MPSAIACLSLFQSEIAVGLSHQVLTPLAHIRRSLARQRPHHHYTVVYVCVFMCVCVCVCVCVFVCVCVS